jgi:hypothetical protein
MVEKDKKNFVIEDKVYTNGVRYYCVYNSDKTQLILLSKCIKLVSAYIGRKHGHWGISR